MGNAPFYSNAMRWGVKAGPGVLLADGLARGRVTAGGQNHPVPGGMLETAENLRREYEIPRRSEEHTSELQSRQYLVCRLLLEKKKPIDLIYLNFAPDL